MALSIPLLLVLIYSPFELGNYFMSVHVVEKGVRDAARYAARLPMTSYPSCSATTTAQDQIKRVAQTGDPNGTAQRLPGWTSKDMTSVTVACDTSGTYTGLYKDFAMGVPVVTVSAQVPYTTLFNTLGLGSVSFTLRSEQQAAVFGA